MKQPESLDEARQAIIDCALEFERGSDIHDKRVKALSEGHEYSIDEMDELDLEKLLAESQLRRAIKHYMAMSTDVDHAYIHG